MGVALVSDDECDGLVAGAPVARVAAWLPAQLLTLTTCKRLSLASSASVR